MRYRPARNWRFAGIVGGLFGAVLLALYPITIKPYFDSDEWKSIQQYSRKDIVQEDIQPGNMKVWSDPFQRKDS